MKKMTLCSLFACFSYFLAAQSVALDSTFGVNGFVETNLKDRNLNPYGFSTSVLADGSIITLGDIRWDSLLLVKFYPDGTLDNDFTRPLLNFSQYSAGIAMQSDDKIIISGHQSVPPFKTILTRLNKDGGIDSTFGSGGVASTFVDLVYVSQLIELSNQKIVVFGSESLNNGNPPTIVVRLNHNGTIDTTFGTDGYFRLNTSDTYEFIPAGLEQPDGKLLFSGMTDWNLFMLRLTPNGNLDSTFSEDGVLIDPMPSGGEAYSVKLQLDGKMVVAGYSDPAYKPMVARYHSDGTRDNTFANQGVHYFSDLTAFQEGVGLEIMPNGKIIVAISNPYGGDIKLAQLLPDGQIDNSFGVNGIYTYPGIDLRSRSIFLDGNKLVLAGLNSDTFNIFLMRFLLDLNVGTINPNTPADPNLWIYPNPISEQFNLQFTLTQKAAVRIQLFDMQGKLVQSLQENQLFDSGAHTLNLSCPEYLPSGNYVLTMEVAGEKRSSVQVFKH